MICDNFWRNYIELMHLTRELETDQELATAYVVVEKNYQLK